MSEGGTPRMGGPLRLTLRAKEAEKKKEAPPSEPAEFVGPQRPPEPTLGNDLIIKEEAPRVKFGRGRILAGAKFGGMFGWDRLGPSFNVGVEVGWVPMLPKVKDTFGLVIDLAYSQPGLSGNGPDARVDGAIFGYSVTVKELMLGVSVVYRATWVKGGKLAAGKFVPYLGIGPRFFFVEAEASGTSGTTKAFEGIKERITTIGLGVPVGADYGIGPGRLFVEALVMWAPLDLNLTGSTTLGAVSVSAGYRFLL